MTLDQATDDQVISWARNYSKHSYALRTYKVKSTNPMDGKECLTIAYRGSHRAVEVAEKWLRQHPFGVPKRESVKLANDCGVYGTKHYKETARKIREIEAKR